MAAFTGVSRILNDRHWMTDVVAGAAIGIGSVHLGYWLSDLIFKGKHINPAYETPSFSYDPGVRHYVASTYFGRRFILGSGRDYFTDGFVTRGGSAGLSTDIPLLPGIGITARIGANSLTYSTGLTSNSFDALAGGYYNLHLGKRFEIQAKAMAGLAWKSGRGGIYRISSDPSEDILDGTSDTISITTLHRTGANLCAGLSLGFLLDDNFKIKAGFLDGELISLEKVDSLAKLPSKEQLLATVCMAFQAPMASFARVIQAIVDKDGEAAPAEAPAEEAAPAAEEAAE